LVETAVGAGCFLFLGLAVEVSQWFLVPAVLLLVGGGFLTLRFRCPQCGKPILMNPIRVLGMWIKSGDIILISWLSLDFPLSFTVSRPGWC
jgi:hypothetical protein